MTPTDDFRARHDAVYSEHAVPEFRYWQLAPRLWAGRNPLSEQDLRELRARGVTHLLDLREEGEWAGLGRVGGEAVALAGEVGIERMHLPIEDCSPPSAAAFTQAAAWLDARFDEPGAVVFAHCRAGLQRTPTILAAWLARREGIAFGGAVHRLQENGYRGEPMPEQRRAAEGWLASREGRRRVRASAGGGGELSLASRIRGSDLSLASRIRGSLLAGALGDALGAPIEFMRWPAIRAKWGERGLTHFAPAYGRLGAITDDTQMTLFTVEGLIRAEVRGRARGICSPPAVVHHAYRRWLVTQGERWTSEPSPDDEPWQPDGWLVGEKFLHARRAPGATCLAALRVPDRYGTRAQNDSKGCGGVMRAAPVGFLFGNARRFGQDGPAEAFAMSVEIAALTHGHPSGQLPAGVLAAIVHGVAFAGRTLAEALDVAIGLLREQTGKQKMQEGEETLVALEAARRLALAGEPSAERVESLGGGWVAEEALAIAVYAALSHPEDLRAALVLAANHSGDSDSTAAICGNLLGAVLGEEALPADLLSELEGREVITQLADDFARRLAGTAPDLGEGEARTAEADAWWERYPGW